MALWIVLIVLLVVVVLVLSRSGSLSLEEARKLASEGAVILDVRSTSEFSQGHLSRAKNLPLNELKSKIGDVAPDKDTVILCHCASGARSASAVNQLKGLGYSKVYNLGGLGRAAKVVENS